MHGGKQRTPFGHVRGVSARLVSSRGDLLAWLWLGRRWMICNLRLPPGSGFPFLRGQPPCWGTVLDIVFRCAEETRRRVQGRDA